MPYANDTGYTPQTVEEILEELREGFNEQFGTTYTTESFEGTNGYKYYYRLAQRVQRGEIKTSEIFANLQQYIAVTNERISRPVNTAPGIIDKMTVEGYVASAKPMIEADAGKINICVDVDETADDYEDVKLAICTLISQITTLGAVTQGAETEAIVLSNGQSFDFKYHLPDRKNTWLRLSLTLSDNNQVVIKSPDEVKAILIANIDARYRLGRNFEPQRYFSIVDAPWASDVLLEYAISEDEPDEEDWQSIVYEANFDDLFEIDLAQIELVEV